MQNILVIFFAIFLFGCANQKAATSSDKSDKSYLPKEPVVIQFREADHPLMPLFAASLQQRGIRVIDMKEGIALMREEFEKGMEKAFAQTGPTSGTAGSRFQSSFQRRYFALRISPTSKEGDSSRLVSLIWQVVPLPATHATTPAHTYTVPDSVQGQNEKIVEDCIAVILKSGDFR